MVPADVSRASLEAEAPAVQAWAARRGWAAQLDLQRLGLVATFAHPADASLLLLVADLTDYRALPPAWRFVDPLTGTSTPRAFPAAGPVLGQSSIFHPNAIICAPWNRLAYADAGGPHPNWGDATNWLTVAEGPVAHTVADMLATIHVHLQSSGGRMG